MLLLVAAAYAWGYAPNPIDGTPLHRIDYTGMQFLANQNIAAGMLNAAGNVWITADSSPIDAINNALGAWNGVATTSARFLTLQMTTLSYDSSDGNDVIVFADDAFTESFTNGIVAITAIASYSCPGNACGVDGQIFDTDIFFSTFVQFSTTQDPGTYDIQSAVTHELGHSMGANHTNILSATMYAFTTQQDTHEQTLSADDVAFVSSMYPASGGNGYGTITGHALVSGAPLLGGMITAVDIFTGTTVGGVSSIADGSYSIQVPPGNYNVFVEPEVNLSLYLQSPQTTQIFTAFQPGFAGGNTSPSVITVQAGGQVNADLSASAAGLTPLRTPYMAIGTAGATGDYQGAFVTRSLTVSSGQSVDLLFGNPVSGTFAPGDIQVIGAASIQPGSLRKDSISLSDGTPVYRVTLNIPPLTSNSSATVMFTDGTNYITRSGVLNLTRPQAVNAGSYLGGAIAPGEILSFFGSQLGPTSAVSNGGFTSDGTLPVSLGGLSVSFGTTTAPLFYVSGTQINLQVPYEIAGQSSAKMTVNYNGSQTAITTLSVAKSAPGIFVVTNADGSVNGPGSPSSAGGVLVIYGTGAGVTTGFLETGAPAPANSIVAATVTINGAPVTPIYAGLTPGSVGLTQVNVAIPPGTPSGNAIPLQVTIAGNPTQTVNIAVK
jgi:uncharacterized protein (TIGR03437 family)